MYVKYENIYGIFYNYFNFTNRSFIRFTLSIMTLGEWEERLVCPRLLWKWGLWLEDRYTLIIVRKIKMEQEKSVCNGGTEV